MAAKKILTLGKSLKENIDDAYEKFITGGGTKGKKITIQKKDIAKKISKQEQVSKRAENLAKKQNKNKKVTKVIKKTDTPVKKLASDATTKRNIKSKINKAEKVFSQKEYNKKLADTLKKNKKNKISKNTTKNTNKQSNALTVTKQPSTKTGTNLVTIPKGTNIVKKKTTALTTIPKNITTNAGKIAHLKKHFGKHWKKYAAGLGVITAGFLVPKDKNPSEGSISDGGNKNKKPPKDFTPKIKTPKTSKVIKKELPKVKTPIKVKKKSRSNIKGSSSYDAQFTYDNLKKRGLKPKGFMSPENYAKVKKLSAGKTVGLKPLPPKSESPGIHKLPAKAKINMGFKPMFGGGFISSLYDKPEKTEKHKGNTTSARQVKGYGKAKKKN